MNSYNFTDLYTVADIDESLIDKFLSSSSMDIAKLGNAFWAPYKDIHKKLNLLHWCLISDDYQKLRFLLKELNLRVEAIYNNGFDQLLPLRIALEFERFQCLKLLWNEFPWYFEGQDIVKQVITKLIWHKYYTYLRSRYLKKYKIKHKSHNKFEIHLKDFLWSQTLISYFEYMKFEERLSFIGELLSFEGCKLDEFEDYFEAGRNKNMAMIDVLEDFK